MNKEIKKEIIREMCESWELRLDVQMYAGHHSDFNGSGQKLETEVTLVLDNQTLLAAKDYVVIEEN